MLTPENKRIETDAQILHVPILMPTTTAELVGLVDSIEVVSTRPTQQTTLDKTNLSDIDLVVGTWHEYYPTQIVWPFLSRDTVTHDDEDDCDYTDTFPELDTEGQPQLSTFAYVEYRAFKKAGIRPPPHPTLATDISG